MEYLNGGRENQIARIQNKVHRPVGFWSDSVYKLLLHLKNEHFEGAPEFFGIDEDGNEILSYIPGHVSNYPLSEAAASEKALITAASLLRTYHDATVGFLKANADLLWMLPANEPQEVICHGDYAPYNVVLDGSKAIAIIDFDAAHPGSRLWDISYALYRWAPLKNPDNPDSLGDLNQQVLRAKQFCDSYGLVLDERRTLVDLMAARLEALIAFMHSEAENGNETFQSNINDGHHLSYLADIEYLKLNHDFITAILACDDQE